VTTAEDTPVTIQALANDVDANQPGMVPAVVSGPLHGSVTINAGGSFTYTPHANYNGPDSFTYNVGPETGGIAGVDISNTATVNINVTSVNDAPQVQDVAADLAEDTPPTLTLLANAVDVDGDTLTIVTGAAAHGTVEVNADGSITYTPNADYHGADSFTYTVSDGQASASATVQLTVTAMNNVPTLGDLSITVAEDSAVSFTALDAAADVDADALYADVVTAPSHGTVTLNADGSFSYQPDADYFGPDSFTYTVSDGALVSNLATVNIDATPVNDAPTLGDQGLAMVEDAVLNGSLLATAADIDSTGLTAAIVDGPAHGTLTINADGTFSYQTNPDYFGSDSFSYTVSDGALLSSLATISIDVTPVNDSPTLEGQSLTVAEDALLTGNLLASSADIDSGSLTALVVDEPAHGRLTVDADGTFSYQANANYNGPDSFTYAVSDGELVSNVAMVSINVMAVNDAPTLADQSLTVAEDNELSGSLLAVAADIDSPTLTVAIVDGPAHGTVTLDADGTFSYRSNVNYNGADSFTYTVSDGELTSNTATVSIDVTAVNDAPTLADQSLTVAEDTQLMGNLLAVANDIDSSTLSAAIVSGPTHGTVTLNADGTFRFHANANYNGSDSFTYTVTDGELTSNTATVSIDISAVNDAPTLADQSLNVAEDNELSGSLLAAAWDIDSSTLTAAIVSGPAHGTVTLNADGTFTYQPNANYNGPDSLIYSVTDGELTSNVATVSINVTAVNDASTLGDQSLTVAEDTELTGNLLATGADIDSASLTAAVVTGPVHGTVALNADGTFSYQANANYNGADSFTYTVNDGELISNVATVSINVTAVNDAPTLGDQSLSVAEDTELTGDLLATGADIDSTALTATIVTGPAHGMITVNADGAFSYQANANYNGPDSFTYTVNDGELASNVATVSIGITAVNDAPTLGDQTLMVAEDTVLSGNLLATGADIESASLTAAVITGPNHGTVTLNADGAFSYQGDANYNGPDSFTYAVSDGELASNVATVSIDVTAVNDAPTLGGQSLSVAEDNELTGSLLATSADIDSTALAAAIVTGPGHGAVTVNADGSFSYKAEANFNGLDSFTYTVNDGELTSNVATVSINVTAVNDAPTLADQSLSVAEDNELAGNLLAAAADIDSSQLTAAIVSGPAHGTLTLNADGTFSYQANANYNGPDSFTYTVSDGALVSNIATVSINITAVNDAPTLGDQSLMVAEDMVLTGSLLTPASDIDSASLTAAIITGPAHGTLTLNADGTFSYQADANYNGADNFTYSVSDGELDSGAATVAIDVTAVNDAPTVTNQAFSMAEDGVLEGDLFATATDVDSTRFYPLVLGHPSHGALTVNADGSFRYEAHPDYFGPDNFVYVVSDGELTSNVAIVNIDVRPVNDAPTLADQSMTVVEDTQLTGNLLASAGDIDSASLTVTIVAGPAYGALTVQADGTFSYQAAADYNGPDSFTYKVSDGELESSIATVTIDVTAVNDAPTLADQHFTVGEDAAVSGNLLDSVSDVDNAAFSAQIVSGPAHGALTMNADGTFTYRADANYNGADSFTYKVSDGQLESTVASVFINVTPINDGPTWTSLAPATFKLTPITGADTTGIYQAGASLTSPAGTPTRLSFDFTADDTALHSEFGIFRVDDASGRIGNLLPGDPGYAAAALSPERSTLIFAGGRGTGARKSVDVLAGQYFGTYLVEGGSSGYWRAKNPANATGAGTTAFFSVAAANPDNGLDHVQAEWEIASTGTARLRMRWEDMLGGGDRDFNDAVISVTGLQATRANPFVYDAGAYDLDGDMLTYFLNEGPVGATIDPITGELIWLDPVMGLYIFTITVTDGQSGTAQQQFTVEVL
jgi:large repetitive protein